MTRERAKELLPVITAFAEGKRVYGRVKGSTDATWHECYEATFGDLVDYHIAPEPAPPVYRPWTCREVPLGAEIIIKSNPNYRGTLTNCNGISASDGYIFRPYAELLSDFTLADGTPCGVRVEESQ